MNRIKTFAALAVIAPLALAGCKKAEEPAPDASASASVAASEAAPAIKPGITVGAGKLVLPAVAGNPAAVYFSVRNTGTAAATIAAVSITGAGKAEMHETKGGSMAPVTTVELAPGAAVNFARGGRHVMAFDLDPTVTAGSTAELTMSFSDGDKASTTLTVEAAGAGR